MTEKETDTQTLMQTPARPPSSLMTLDQMMLVSDRISKTDIVPANYRGKPDAILAAMIYGQELGFSPIQSLHNFYTVSGKVAITAEGLTALAYRSGLVEHLESEGVWNKVTEMWEGRCTIQRRGFPPVTHTFTEEQARRADLSAKPMYHKYPERMYRARAVSFAIRDVFPDVIRGLMSVEEMLTGETDFPTDPGMPPAGYQAFVDSILDAATRGGTAESTRAYKKGTQTLCDWLKTQDADMDRIAGANKAFDITKKSDPKNGDSKRKTKKAKRDV
jgi:hypothetical protein